MQMRVGSHASAADIAGIKRNFGVYQDYVHIVLFVIARHEAIQVNKGFLHTDIETGFYFTWIASCLAMTAVLRGG